MILTSLRLVTLVVLTAVLGACAKDNPNFCQGADCTATDGPIDSPPVSCSGNGPDPACPAGNPICVAGACTGLCTADSDCDGRAAAEGVCHGPSGACVTCDEDDRQAEPGSSEEECPGTNNSVCDADTHTCRACEAHGECFSGVCDAGLCATVASVIYVDVDGADGGGCGSLASPCLTLNAAVDKVQADNVNIKYIVMAPSATDYQARNNTDRADFAGVNVLVVGTGASVFRNGDGMVIDVSGSSNVTIDGLTIKNGRTLTGHGVQCTSSTLTLRAATVANNDGLGIAASSCNLTLVGTTVQRNDLAGIEASNTNLEVRRSKITGNTGGGLALSSGTFTIVNNIIDGNGTVVTSSYGGLSLSSGVATNKLEFNTIAHNASQAGAPDGVTCTNDGLVARNNIIVGADLKPHVNLGTNCLHRYTLFTPDGLVAGEGNVLVPDLNSYLFTSLTDLHIGAGSVAAGKAQSTGLTGELLFDIDGDARAAGGGTVDVGADEIP